MMNVLRHRSSVASHHDRLSYLHGPEQLDTMELIHTFNPCKNLNDVFESIAEDSDRMENLRVYLRVRPRLAEEVQHDEDTQVDILDDHIVVLTAPTCSNTFKNSVRGITKLSHKFTFTHVYGPSVSQEELFQSSTLSMVTDFINGQNCLIFTYGATNSGKTFTAQGTPGDAGLLPRTLQHIFSMVGEHQYSKNDLKPKFSCSVIRLEEQDVLKEEEKREGIFKILSNLTTTSSHSTMSLFKASICEVSLNSTEHSSESIALSHNTTEAGDVEPLDTTSSQDLACPRVAIYVIFVSFAEIYNEYIFDLLEKIPSSKGKKRNSLMLGEDRNGAIYIKGLNEVRVRTADEALQLLNIGRQNLHFAATRLNQNSSRSHCIFTIKLVRLADADNPHVARVSVLSLCDLAGAERAAKTLGTQDRLKESGNINTSLLTLSRCIEALRFNQTHTSSKKVPVPYRDSKLTRLFQSFLLGRGKAAMIVNISKIPLLFDETLQVLKFSAIANQITISQKRESEVPVVHPSRRVSRLSKMVRQSLKGSGRLSVPWGKATAPITFGESQERESKEEEVKRDLFEEEEEDADEEEEEDEQVQALIQLISKLKEELLKEHKEKQDLEERLRRELCKEFSEQLVQIQSSWSQRLKDQENLYEELTECKIQAFMKSVKNCNKRMRCDEDPDEEYVSSVFLFREQEKVKEQMKCIEELEAEKKFLEDEVETLKEYQKKTSELVAKAQEENSRLTFGLSQLTCNYDKVVQELKEARSLSIPVSADNTEAVQELKAQLEARCAQLAEQDQEIQELQNMLLEASECYTSKEKRCASLEKILESNQFANTQQLMHISELESQLEGARGMLSQQATQVEEREQDIEDLRQLLSQERKTKEEELEAKEQSLKKIEEDHIRGKSKLLLEIAVLKRNLPKENGDNAEELKVLEEKVSQLQEEKETLKKGEESVRKKQEEEISVRDMHIKSLEEKLSLMEKELSEKENDFKEESKGKVTKIEGLERRLQEYISCQEELKAEKEAEISRLMHDIEALSSETLSLKVARESLNTQLKDAKSSLKEKEDIETELQENLSACKAELEELQESYALSKEKGKENEAMLQHNYDTCKAELEDLREAYISLKEKEKNNEAQLRERESTYKDELEELEKAHASLKEENASLQSGLQDKIGVLEKLKMETEIETKEKDEHIAKNMALYDELRAEVEELKRLQSGQDNIVKEVTQLRETNAGLEAQVEKLKVLPEEKALIQTQVQMLELDKKKMGERLYNLQEANLLKAQQAQTEIQTLVEQLEILAKENKELESKVEESHKLSQEQASLVDDKQEVILALSSKIESLDAKLNQADQELREKNHQVEKVEAAKEKIIRLETKCDMHEKEIRALREARQAEVQESFNRTKDHEELVRQKDVEISTLQQEVKKLLQQSLSSNRSSISETPPASSAKAEVSQGSDELQILKEQLRLTVAHNSTLMQEVSTLRTQVARQSTTSETSVLRLSAPKSPEKKQRSVTRIQKEGRGRKAKPSSTTPSTSSCMESTHDETRELRNASPSLSPPPSAPTSTSKRPERMTRRTMRYNSEEYELRYKQKSEDDTKGSRQSRAKSKAVESPKPILQDQENKSNFLPQPKNSSASRRKRILYNCDDLNEPFLCAPELNPQAPPEDSPLTTVRRQLRNKKK